MDAITREAYLQRVRSAVGLPILYWLGHGGSVERPPAEPTPGTPIDPQRAFARKQGDNAAVARQYELAMRQLGLAFTDLPRSACDCSGFVAWALGVPRSPQPLSNGWMNTDSIHADASGAQSQFAPVAMAGEGTLLVYPKGGGHAVGHVAVVTAVDARGEPTEIVHCAPENYLIEPPPGEPRSSIRRTDARAFTGNPSTLRVEYRRFAA